MNDLMLAFERGYAHGALSEVARMLGRGDAAMALAFARDAVAVLDQADKARTEGRPMSLSEFKAP